MKKLTKSQLIELVYGIISIIERQKDPYSSDEECIIEIHELIANKTNAIKPWKG